MAGGHCSRSNPSELNTVPGRFQIQRFATCPEADRNRLHSSRADAQSTWAMRTRRHPLGKSAHQPGPLPSPATVPTQKRISWKAPQDLLHLGDVNHGTGDPGRHSFAARNCVSLLVWTSWRWAGSLAILENISPWGVDPTRLVVEYGQNARLVANTLLLSIVDLTRPKSLRKSL